MQITFDNSQVTQGLELVKAGVPIPPTSLIRHSNLVDKWDILKEMASQEGSAPQDPTVQAKADLLMAQAKKTAAETAEIKAGTVYTLTQSAMGIATNGGLVNAIDELGKSVGFQDENGGEIIDGPVAGNPNPVPQGPHTNPMSAPRPLSPMQGMNRGIETLANNQ